VTGASAFGGADAAAPLRGALLFGNDPKGAPRGAEAFGGADADDPLRGALLFGNDPAGAPRGAEAFGGADKVTPLKGALLFGNDPAGGPRGAAAFGEGGNLQMRGAAAFGAPQLLPERLEKDPLGYDFAGVMLVADPGGLAGVRKSTNNHLRERVLGYLERRLGVDRARLRHGLGEEALPWGRLRREPELDRALAEMLRQAYRRAPGGVLGVGQVRDLLEQSHRMHTYELRCAWDHGLLQLAITRRKERLARGDEALYLTQRYFVFKDLLEKPLGYVDALAAGQAVARLRDAKGETVARFELSVDEPDYAAEVGCLVDGRDRLIAALDKAPPASLAWRGLLLDEDDTEIGRVAERPAEGGVSLEVELDTEVAPVVVFGLATQIVDWRRREPPAETPAEPEAKAKSEAAAEPAIESIEQALGPRRPRR
jgi:hypothetical protein